MKRMQAHFYMQLPAKSELELELMEFTHTIIFQFINGNSLILVLTMS